MLDGAEAERGDEAIAWDETVLEDLRHAEEHYLAVREQAEQQAAHLAEIEGHLEREREHGRHLHEHIGLRERELEQVKGQAKRYRERSERLTHAMKDVYRAIWGGNIYDLILRASLSIVGATRGLYVTTPGPDGPFRVRSAIDVDGYPSEPPSERIIAICRGALSDDNKVVADTRDDLGNFPAPQRNGENFENLMAVPVVLMRNLSGVVIAADKVHGRFDDEDAEALLNVGDQAGVALQNVELRRQLQNAYLATVGILADAMELKDPYTQGHCEQVSSLARRVARRLGVSPEEENLVCYAGLLHDTGKIGVSDGILNKPGALLIEERDLVRSHVRIGHDLIVRVPTLDKVANVVLHHHESWDGSGYPEGLRGDEIPLASRIIAVADAYCAMISRRSYKEAYSDEEARKELRRCSGSQFDPRVVDAFLEVLDGSAPEDEEDDCGLLPGFGVGHHALRVTPR